MDGVNSSQDGIDVSQNTNELRIVTDELENLKIAISLSEQSKLEEIQSIKERCEEDVLSLRQIMKESLQEANASNCEKVQLIERENAELKAKIIILETSNLKLSKDNELNTSTNIANSPPEKDSFLSNISKSFQRKATTQDPENLEYIMQKAQESNEILKSVVLPLETEIKSLKMELSETKTKLKLLEDSNSMNTLAGNMTLDAVKSSDCSSASQNSISASSSSCTNDGKTNVDSSDKVEMNDLMTLQDINDYKNLRKETSSLTKELNALRRKSEMECQVTHSLREQLDSVQSKLNDANTMNSNRLTELTKCIMNGESAIRYVHTMLVDTDDDIRSNMKQMTNDRLQVDLELKRLQSDNDFLVDKHALSSRQLQDQDIDLPNNVDDLQVIILTLREDLIKAKVNNEYIVRKYKSEKQMLKDQHQTYQQEQHALEISLTEEIDHLQKNQNALIKATEELADEGRLREELQSRFSDLQATLETVKITSRSAIDTLQSQAQLATTKKNELEATIRQLKIRLQTLQVEYDNSEAVQQDFVKLSQSLQVQLEKLRSSDREVRFQHEDDYENCNDCHQKFPSIKQKHHCRHCGHLFCAMCLNQKVSSGPNRRPMAVCKVCHTMLVQDATPYFSQS